MVTYSDLAKKSILSSILDTVKRDVGPDIDEIYYRICIPDISRSLLLFYVSKIASVLQLTSSMLSCMSWDHVVVEGSIYHELQHLGYGEYIPYVKVNKDSFSLDMRHIPGITALTIVKTIYDV